MKSINTNKVDSILKNDNSKKVHHAKKNLEKPAEWIMQSKIHDYMKGNSSTIIVPRLFGDGERTLIACRVRDCTIRENCPNYCQCNRVCHCVSQNQSSAIV